MDNIHQTLATLTRPKILIRTARAGVSEYSRKRYLKSIGGIPMTLYGNRLLDSLLNEEARMENLRKSHDVNYSPRRHVTVLTALLAEAGYPLEMKQAA